MHDHKGTACMAAASPSELRTRRVSIGDAELSVETCGVGPDVMLVPGLGGKGAFWHHQQKFLATRFRVTCHDHRGCGGSTRSLIAYSVAQMADDVLRLMDRLAIESAHLVGHSTGGAIGQHLARHHPERIDRLVLSGTWAGPSALFLETFRLRRQVLVSCGPESYYLLGQLLAAPAHWLMPQFEPHGFTLAERVRDFPGLEIELSRLSAVISHDLRAEVSRIVARTLVIGAQDDQLTPHPFQAELAALIPGARLSLLDSGGHFFPMTRADEFNARVGAFLQE